MSSNSGGNYALKFISGKYTGVEFPLRPSQPATIGRGNDQDIVLAEDMVSRKHAKVTFSDEKFFLEDLGSTNGTYVNGDKVLQAAMLREGDRILIGTSIIRLTRLAQEKVVDHTEAKAQLKQAAEENSARVTKTGGIMGKLEDLSLADLLQLFHTSKKTGILSVRGQREGRIYMRRGHVCHAAIDGQPGISPRKSFARMATWNEGEFELLGSPDEAQFPNEIEESIEALLMESFRQHDEFQRLNETLPPLLSALTVCKPLTPPLTELSKEQLEVFQLIHNHSIFQLVLDHSTADDAHCSEAILELIRRGYVSLA